jgi:hypothetical protein
LTPPIALGEKNHYKIVYFPKKPLSLYLLFIIYLVGYSIWGNKKMKNRLKVLFALCFFCGYSGICNGMVSGTNFSSSSQNNIGGHSTRLLLSGNEENYTANRNSHLYLEVSADGYEKAIYEISIERKIEREGKKEFIQDDESFSYNTRCAAYMNVDNGRAQTRIEWLGNQDSDDNQSEPQVYLIKIKGKYYDKEGREVYSKNFEKTLTIL